MSKRKRRRERRSRRTPSSAITAQPGPRPSVRDPIPTDYTYTIRDLKRIALYGGLLLAGLVALSFVIQ